MVAWDEAMRMRSRSRLQLDAWGHGLDGELLIVTDAGAEGGN
jgi:hypothetical protein